MMSSTEWLVEHLAEVPVLVIPCYEPYMASRGGDEADSFQHGDGLRVDLPGGVELPARAAHPGLRHLHHDAAPPARAGGRAELLGIPDTYVQGCLLPVGTTPRRHRRSTRRRDDPIEEVVAVDGWDGPSL